MTTRILSVINANESAKTACSDTVATLTFALEERDAQAARLIDANARLREDLADTRKHYASDAGTLTTALEWANLEIQRLKEERMSLVGKLAVVASEVDNLRAALNEALKQAETCPVCGEGPTMDTDLIRAKAEGGEK